MRGSLGQPGLVAGFTPCGHDAAMKVLFFAQLREAAGTAEAEVVADKVDAAQLWDLLLVRWPGLASYRTETRLARNGAYAGAGEIFGPGDEVALIPPVSGG